MKIRETIAFIGETDQYSERLISRLAGEKHPLVLVSKPDESAGFIANRIAQDYPLADVEVVNCEREGCWESDVILLSASKQPERQLIEKMKIVAAQKILLRLLPNEDVRAWEQESVLFEKELPYTKLVWASPDKEGDKIHLKGNDLEGIRQITTILTRAGYTIHSGSC